MRIGQLQNLYLNQREKQEKKVILSSKPICLQIEFTNRCNINCPMCFRIYAPPQPNDLPDTLFEKMQAFIPTLCQLKPDRCGEPLLHPRFAAIMQSIPDDIPLFLTSNLQLFDHAIGKSLKKKHGEVNISLDAATAQTYRAIRNGDFEKVLEHIRWIKKETTLGIRLNMTVFRYNVSEVESFLRLAEKLKAGTVMFIELIQFGQATQKIPIEPLTAPEKKSLETILAKKRYPFCIHNFQSRSTYYPSFFSLQRLTGQIMRGDITSAFFFKVLAQRTGLACTKPWEHLVIDAFGKGSVCCEQTAFADLTKQSIEEIWNGPILQQIRQDIAAHRIPPQCSQCRFLKDNTNWL